jgi:hypothetical protein
MIYYKVAFETTNCLRPCIERFLHRIPLRYDNLQRLQYLHLIHKCYFLTPVTSN